MIFCHSDCLSVYLSMFCLSVSFMSIFLYMFFVISVDFYLFIWQSKHLSQSSKPSPYILVLSEYFVISWHNILINLSKHFLRSSQFIHICHITFHQSKYSLQSHLISCQSIPFHQSEYFLSVKMPSSVCLTISQPVKAFLSILANLSFILSNHLPVSQNIPFSLCKPFLQFHLPPPECCHSATNTHLHSLHGGP